MLSSKALEVAKTQLGVEESPRGSNWGFSVQVYLKSVGITFPASWCMAFVESSPRAQPIWSHLAD